MSSYPAPPSQWSSAGPPGPQPGRRGWAFGSELASWPARSAATFIDFAVTIWLPSRLPGELGFWLAVVLVVLNSIFMQSRTGQSLGKVLLGLQLVWPIRDENHDIMAAYVPLGRCTARIVLHVADLIGFIGFLRRLWDFHRQPFADSWTKTVVLAGRPMLPLRVATGRAKSMLD